MQNDLLQLTVDTESDVLKHYGVLGMKWGVRKSVSRVGRRVKAAGSKVAKKVRRTSKSVRNKYKNRKRAVHTLSDRTLAKRMRIQRARQTLKLLSKDKNVPRASRRAAARLYKKGEKTSIQDLETRIRRIQNERDYSILIKGNKSQRQFKSQLLDSATRIAIAKGSSSKDAARRNTLIYDIMKSGVSDNMNSITKYAVDKTAYKKKNRP